ncbi:MAG: 50S ribosomal protein L32 [Dehalococcoidia bacterium]
MPPLPKRKRSKSRVGSHRAHRGLRLINLSRCPQCDSPRRSHQACRVCGTYAGRDVLPVQEVAE